MEALIGIAFGAGLAWLAAAYGQRRAEQAEHLKWLREHRYEVWTEAYAVYLTMWHFRDVTPKEEQVAQQLQMRETIARMTLLGPGTVVAAATRLHDACLQLETGKSADELKVWSTKRSRTHTTPSWQRPCRSCGRSGAGLSIG